MFGVVSDLGANGTVTGDVASDFGYMRRFIQKVSVTPF